MISLEFSAESGFRAILMQSLHRPNEGALDGLHEGTFHRFQHHGVRAGDQGHGRGRSVNSQGVLANLLGVRPQWVGGRAGIAPMLEARFRFVLDDVQGIDLIAHTSR